MTQSDWLMAAICMTAAPLLAFVARFVTGLFVAPDSRPPLVVFLATAGLLCLWTALAGPRDLMLAATLGLGCALIVLAVVDVIEFRLPDAVTLPLIVAGLLVSLTLPDPDPIGHLAGAAGGYGVFALVAFAYRRIRGRDGLGLGDAKLMAAAGAWLGWQALPSVILLACAAAFVWIALSMLRRGREAVSARIAFGAPIALAMWIVWLHGPLGAFV